MIFKIDLLKLYMHTFLLLINFYLKLMLTYVMIEYIRFLFWRKKMNDKTEEILESDLIYFIYKKDYDETSLKSLLLSHPEIQFISLVGVDLGGNDTDEKIPISVFLDNINEFIKIGIQTDGSSVVLPKIATLNNGKVDLIPDTEAKWFIDYNYENIDCVTKKPIGTLRIPCFLKHNNKYIDSRSILKQVSKHFQSEIIKLFDSKELCQHMGFAKEDIVSVNLTVATELEFWVRSPENNSVKASELSASEIMQEQYWKRTKHSVRTALERSLTILENYGLKPEMGHKEVGGVKAKLTSDGTTIDILEQLEIDWLYSEALQAADNELLARTFIKEIFQEHGLDVSFKAKPIDDVAGSGEHTHIGVSILLKNGKIKNIFNPQNKYGNFLSIPGWGALMGILKNYEVLNPFISATNDSLKRLKPGFEAPVCIVASIGTDVKTPSRNRTVLIGLIRDFNSPLATRFEVRSPNPHSNTYLVIATLYQAMLDGIYYAVNSKKTMAELEAEFKKGYREPADYLENNRVYHSELDVFESYSKEEREKFFGKHPSTVWENLEGLSQYPEKLNILFPSGAFTELIIYSYSIGVQKRWLTEITNRIIPQIAKRFSNIIPLHYNLESTNSLDEKRWKEIKILKMDLLKDCEDNLSLFTKIRIAIKNKNYNEVSRLQIIIQDTIREIEDKYLVYKRNIIEF